MEDKLLYANKLLQRKIKIDSDEKQKILISIWKNIDNYKMEDLKMIINCATNNIIKDRTRKKITTTILDDHNDSHELSPEQQRIYQEEKDMLYNGLKILSEIDQEIITLFYLDNYSHKEIAIKLNLNPKQIKSKCYRAIQKLKKYKNIFTK